jgi:hypothetical protein
MASIALCDPATGAMVECPVHGLTADELAALPLDEEVCGDCARGRALLA